MVVGKKTFAQGKKGRVKLFIQFFLANRVVLNTPLYYGLQVIHRLKRGPLVFPAAAPRNSCFIGHQLITSGDKVTPLE